MKRHITTLLAFAFGIALTVSLPSRFGSLVRPAKASPSTTTPYQDGSRLHMQVMTGSDGSSFGWGLYDTSLNVTCGWQLASDGSYRCIPTSNVVTGGANNGIYYKNSNCTGDVWPASSGVTGCLTGAKYLTVLHENDNNACTVPYVDVYEITPSYETLSTVYYLNGTTCESTGGDYSSLPITKVLKPSAFVEGNTSVQ